MRQDTIGFPDFQNEVHRQIGPLLDSATVYLEIGRDMFSRPFSGQLALVLGQIAQSVSNSMKSVMILVSNGCADDALRIDRTMFESAVTIHYLDGHPELVQDYVDFLWVKRKRYYDHLVEIVPSQAQQVDPQWLEQMNIEYERVRSRFTNSKGRVRNSWCKVTFRAMVEEVKATSMYWGLYEFPSSFIHTDALGLASRSGGTDDVVSDPSQVNLSLTLHMGIFTYAMTLTAVNQVAESRFDDRLDEAFSQLKRASVAAAVL